MREVLNGISEKVKSIFAVSLITLFAVLMFITLIMYLPVDFNNDKIFKVLALCEIALILIISMSMYRLLKKDFSIMRKAAAETRDAVSDVEIVNNMSYGILYVDSYGKIKIANRAMCDFIGLEQSSLIDKYIFNIAKENMDIDYNNEVIEKTIDVLEEKRQAGIFELINNENEKLNDSIVNSKIVYDKDNNRNGLMVEVMKLSDREIDMEKLMQVEKLAAAGQMVAGLAHEIKNSICSIRGLAQMMKKKQRGENERYYDVILEEINHTNSLVQNLLSLTKTRNIYENIEINRVINDIIPLIESSASYNGVCVNLNIESNLPKIFGNREYIRQVIVNIVQNAIEELNKNGRIDIKVWLDKKDEYIKLEFKDNGPGIKPEHLERIFEPFFTTKEGGSGLGLAISYEIVRKHQGKMSAFNNPEGGATFLIEFPIKNSGEKYYKVS